MLSARCYSIHNHFFLTNVIFFPKNFTNQKLADGDRQPVIKFILAHLPHNLDVHCFVDVDEFRFHGSIPPNYGVADAVAASVAVAVAVGVAVGGLATVISR